MTNFFKIKHIYKLVIISLFYINISNSYAKRYICTHGEKKEFNFTNLYLSEDYLSTSGAIGKGQYKVIIYFKNSGAIAINSSKIGTEVGSEIIFIDLNKMIFSYSSRINRSIEKEQLFITGKCR